MPYTEQLVLNMSVEQMRPLSENPGPRRFRSCFPVSDSSLSLLPLTQISIRFQTVMARTQRQRADSFSTSSESSFDSNEQLSDMEEPDNSQVTTDKKQKKIWVMRSGVSAIPSSRF